MKQFFHLRNSGISAAIYAALHFLLVFFSAPATTHALEAKAAATPQAPKSAKPPVQACYWMENASSRFEWVPAEIGGMYHGEGIELCFALDSCDGGLGQSSGGCYKWSAGSQGTRIPWPKK